MLIERGAIWNGPSRWLPVDYHGKYSAREFLRERQCENSFNVPSRLRRMERGSTRKSCSRITVSGRRIKPFVSHLYNRGWNFRGRINRDWSFASEKAEINISVRVCIIEGVVQRSTGSEKVAGWLRNVSYARWENKWSPVGWTEAWNIAALKSDTLIKFHVLKEHARSLEYL